ncbi:MAG: hypothetical protein U0Q15_03530 [Kineosporiaceae bacterium]
METAALAATAAVDSTSRCAGATPVTGWTVRAVAPKAGWPTGAPDAVREGLVLAATVPGVVHVDLIAAGLAGDVTVDGTEAADAWIMRTGWEYRTVLAAPPRAPRRALLVFDGIDTIADVVVNGTVRLHATDMHRTYAVDVTDDLAAGDVEVVVALTSALEVAEPREAANPLPRPDIYELPYNQVRKMACSYGWDWGPITGSAGLWRDVTLVTWDDARLDDVRVVAGFDGGTPAGTPVVDVAVTLDVAGDAGAARWLEVAVTRAGDDTDAVLALAAVGEAGVSVHVEVPGAAVWHPVGEGDQPLYDVTVDLRDAEGTLLDSARRRVGFRTVAVVQEPDEHGVSCELHVNGARLWVRGLNWIPDDPFPSRITRERLRERITQAVDAGANLLRIWGGGIFESEDFYDLCDELGVLVWQDFLFACAPYDEHEETVADVRAEARDNVARLRHRASLAVWSGCNENLWGYETWGWQPVLDGRAWGALYYAQVLPQVVAEVDGTRPYLPGSPFSPGGQPNAADGPPADDETRGTVHLWDVWNSLDYTAYEDSHPRFAAEFGYQAPASWHTLAAAVGADPDPSASTAITAADPRLEVHQKAADGSAKLAAGLARHWAAPPADGLSWYYATQLLQARAVTTGIGHLRAQYDTCSGTIWWQHNDLWPSISWSIVDVRGRRKLAWYAMREAYRARTAVLGAGGVLALVDDGRAAWTPRVELTALTAAGEVLGRGVVDAPVQARGAVRVPLADVDGLGPALDAADVVVADVPADGLRVTRWLRPDLDLPAVDPGLSVTVDAVPGGVAVTVTADALARDVCLLAEVAAPDALVDRQLVTLLPGEHAVFTVTGPGVADVPPQRWAGLVVSDATLRG